MPIMNKIMQNKQTNPTTLPYFFNSKSCTKPYVHTVQLKQFISQHSLKNVRKLVVSRVGIDGKGVRMDDIVNYSKALSYN